VLPFLEPVDLVLTDPPYGINVAPQGLVGSKSTKRLATCKDYGATKWDKEPPPRWLIDQTVSHGRNAIVWGGNHYGLPAATCWLVWDKDNEGTAYADCELAWTNLPKAVRKIKWRWNGMLQENGGDKKEPRMHPTQKPLAVMKWAISQAPDTVQTVLDPFMGVGTTLVAAKLMGKRAIGIEVSTEYCEKAVERLRQGVLPFVG
jgi:DNA modification methylase